MHALERRQSPTGCSGEFGQRLNEKSQREGIVAGAWGISVQPAAMVLDPGVA